MTWSNFFSLNTIESRHLLFSYAGIFLLQGGYLAWMLRKWKQTPPTHLR